MASLEICLVVVGLVLVIGSFILVEKLSDKELQEIAKYNEYDLKRMTEKEVEKAKEEISKSVEESLAESKEMIADSFSEVTNEKMMAISEYSDTVLNEINKRHQEVMFLYKMLTEKQDGIQEMAGEMNRTKEDIKNLLVQVVTRLDAKSVDTEIIEHDDIEPYPGEKPEEGVYLSDYSSGETSKKELFERSEDTKTTEKDNSGDPKIQSDRDDGQNSVLNTKENAGRMAGKKSRKNSKRKKQRYGESVSGKSMEGQADAKERSKEEIINLHKTGIEDVEIARILHMGVGEVRLIIDLYKKDH